MCKKYLATIITPFHNTEMSMFNETVRSVMDQTIGFENIQWVIVLHNCTKEYEDAVHELLDPYGNVQLIVLKNSAKSASSPRNYGLKFVESPYVEFLDSDDTINKDTVKVCLKTIERHHADLIVFRMAYIRQNETVRSVITDVTLWNPMKREIVLEGDKVRSPELYTTINFCTHNKFFRYDYLKEGKFAFDEDITMAEDAYFTLNCFVKASKIIVLPQFIGHFYFVNNNSAVQNMNKTPEQVLHFSYGFKKMFDLLLDNKVYYNHFFLTIMQQYIMFALLSPGFGPENWEMLQNDMRPYAELLTPPPVNKFFTKEEGQMAYDFVRHHILDPKEDPEKESKAFLNGEKILVTAIRKNRNSDFGRYYHFEKISSIEAFRKKVPVRKYRDYKKLIDLQTEVGESQVITTHNIEVYATGWGEGEVPVADELACRLGDDFIQECSGQVTFLLPEPAPKEMRKNDGAYVDSLTGLMIKNGLEKISILDVEKSEKFTTPVNVLSHQSVVSIDYISLLLALRNPSVTQIYSGNSHSLSEMLDLLMKKREDICFDIACGSVSCGDKDSLEFAKYVPGLDKPDRERAKAIRNALGKEKKDILTAIWPGLERVIVRNDCSHVCSSEQVEEWCENIQLDSGDFVTPFGILGRGIGKKNVYELAMENAFYEFLPAGNTGEGGTLLMSELEKGREYEMVITNEYGIYRMKTGIYIRALYASAYGLWFEKTDESAVQ